MRDEIECYVLCAYGDTPQSRALIEGYRTGCSREELGKRVAAAAVADRRIHGIRGRTNSRWVGDRKAV